MLIEGSFCCNPKFVQFSKEKLYHQYRNAIFRGHIIAQKVKLLSCLAYRSQMVSTEHSVQHFTGDFCEERGLWIALKPTKFTWR